MRRFTHYATALLLAAATLFAVSCDDTDELEPTDPDAEYDAILKVKEDSVENPNVNYTVDATTGATIKTKVTFVNTEGTEMKRLYVTANAGGTGAVAFEDFPSSVNLKDDGAIGLEASNGDEFTFEFDLPVPDSIDAGTLVYTFWATFGNGDMRDVTKRLAVGPGTITVTYGGSNANQDALAVKSFADVKLEAPTADGNSETFVSLVDGTTFNVNSGVEYASQWDIGYLYSVATTNKATLRPPYNYPAIAIDIPAKSGEENDLLNKTYFEASSLTTAEFDAVETSGDLKSITVAETEANLIAVELEEGDVVEFVDNYGKKGLIKVLQVNGTNGSDGFIRIAIKVQP